MATPQQQARAGGQGVEDAAPDHMAVEDAARQPLARPLGQDSVTDPCVPERLDRMKTLLKQPVQQRAVKDWYTTAAAQLLGRAEFTVREG